MSYRAKQVIVIRKDLNMRKGKMIAQGAHASMAAYKQADKEAAAFKEWDQGAFAKICLSVNSESDLMEVYSNALVAKLNVSLITDNGATEFHGVPTHTCLAIGPHYSEEIDPVTQRLPLL